MDWQVHQATPHNSLLPAACATPALLLRAMQVKYAADATCAANFNCAAVTPVAMAANTSNADISLATVNIVDVEAAAALCCQPIVEDTVVLATVAAWIADLEACKDGECLEIQASSLRCTAHHCVQYVVLCDLCCVICADIDALTCNDMHCSAADGRQLQQPELAAHMSNTIDLHAARSTTHAEALSENLVCLCSLPACLYSFPQSILPRPLRSPAMQLLWLTPPPGTALTSAWTKPPWRLL